MIISQRKLEQAQRLLVFEERDGIAREYRLPVIRKCADAILGQLTK
jgi:hypothetical protein